jgi:3-phenylpropionate/cinnamic acid dioxygenase small subunit
VNDAVAIANLVARYAELVDAGDLAGVGALFAHATYRAAVGDQVFTSTGADEVTRTMTSMVRTYDGVPATRHVMSNLIIDVDEADGQATCRSTYTVLQAAPGQVLQPILTGRYQDRFERADGSWRFTDRLIHADLIGDLSQHLRQNPYAG